MENKVSSRAHYARQQAKCCTNIILQSYDLKWFLLPTFAKNCHENSSREGS